MSRPAMTPMALEWEQRQDGYRARKVRAFIDFGIRIDPEVLDHDESQIHLLRTRSRWSWWWMPAALDLGSFRIAAIGGRPLRTRGT